MNGTKILTINDIGRLTYKCIFMGNVNSIYISNLEVKFKMNNGSTEEVFSSKNQEECIAFVKSTVNWMTNAGNSTRTIDELLAKYRESSHCDNTTIECDKTEKGTEKNTGLDNIKLNVIRHDGIISVEGLPVGTTASFENGALNIKGLIK